jgi:hypothetical protein
LRYCMRAALQALTAICKDVSGKKRQRLHVISVSCQTLSLRKGHSKDMLGKTRQQLGQTDR